MTNRFYINAPLALGPVVVTGPEAHHLAGVCRLQAGDTIRLFNGDGKEYPATVLEAGRRSVKLEILAVETLEREIGFHLEVAAPLPKGDRTQFLLEKLTEIGVTSFVPIDTERSVIRASAARMEKLQRHVIEASKQCGRNTLLQVRPPIAWAQYCIRADLPLLRVLANPGAAGESWPARSDVALAVGPEGGLTEAEVACARQAGWRLVGLGPRILRIETAALVLVAWAVGGAR